MDLPSCLSGGVPVLMAGILKAKHVDWNSRLITRGRHLHDYTSEISCLIYELYTPTTIPYNNSATSDVIDIVITDDLVTPVSLITCTSLSSDKLPVVIYTQ